MTFIDLVFLCSGVNTSQAEIQVISEIPLEPAKLTPAGLPIETLTYGKKTLSYSHDNITLSDLVSPLPMPGVTLQNATNLPAVRANAEALLLTSPLLRQYLVLPEQTANLTSRSTTTTANPVIILVVPQSTAGSTTATAASVNNLNLQQPAVKPTGNMHTFDGYITSSNDMALVLGDLQTLWAQAYGVPPQTLEFHQLGVSTLSTSGTERPVTRIQYSVAAPNQTETAQVRQTFLSLLAQSSLATIQARPVGATSVTSHSLRVAVANPIDMDRLNNGIRTSWIAALSMLYSQIFNYFQPTGSELS